MFVCMYVCMLAHPSNIAHPPPTTHHPPSKSAPAASSPEPPLSLPSSSLLDPPPPSLVPPWCRPPSPLPWFPSSLSLLTYTHSLIFAQHIPLIYLSIYPRRCPLCLYAPPHWVAPLRVDVPSLAKVEVVEVNGCIRWSGVHWLSHRCNRCKGQLRDKATCGREG